MSVETATETPLTSFRTEDGLFVCPYCNETKNRANTMFYHIKKHTGVCKHICECGKKFIQKSGLDQHRIQSHSPESAVVWSCGFCPQTSKTRVNIMIHVGRCHSDGWIPTPIKNVEQQECSGCERKFASDTAYFYHAVGCFGQKAPDNIKEKLISCKCLSKK